MHRETKSSHNPTGPPREIRVFFSPSPQSSQRSSVLASLAMQEVLMGDSAQAFCSRTTRCLFHSVELISRPKGRRNQWHPEWEQILVFAIPRVDAMGPDKADPRFPALPEPPQPTTGPGPGPGMVPCPPSSPTCTQQLHVASGNISQAGFPQRLFTHLKCQPGYFALLFSLSPSLPSSSLILT